MPSGYSSLGGQVKNPYAPALDDEGRADRLARRVELGLGGRGGGRAVRRRDRHRDLGLAVVAGDAERARHGEADRRPRQPRRHPADRAQPGHRRPLDPQRARRGDPAQRAGRAAIPPTRRPRQLQRPARLHRRARCRRAARRAHRRAGRPRRPRQRRLLRPARRARRRRSSAAPSRSSKRRARRSSAPTSRPRAGSTAPAPRWRSSTATRRARPGTSRCVARSSSSTS